MNSNELVPNNIEEAMEAFSRILENDEKVRLATSTKEKLILYHNNLGRWIRNNWKLWEGGPLLDHMKSLGFIHPDDMSQALIHEYWARLNSQPSTIEEEIKKYAEYWEKVDTMKKAAE